MKKFCLHFFLILLIIIPIYAQEPNLRPMTYRCPQTENGYSFQNRNWIGERTKGRQNISWSRP